MLIKIVNALLMLLAMYMGIKHGWAMLMGKREMLEMFGKWHMGKEAVMALGLANLLAVALMLFPVTFLWGNFLMAAGILLIICFHLTDQNFKGVGIELPFFLLSLVIIYFGHPLARNI